MLLENLPRESAYVRERAGDAAQWGDAEYLLAIVADRVDVLIWQNAAIHRAANTSAPDPPKPLRRPGGTGTPTPPKMSLREMVRMMTKAKQRRPGT